MAPDLFAVTSLLLDGGRYERIVDPPSGRRWPPQVASGSWQDDVKRVATSWKNELTNGHARAKRSAPVRTWFKRRRPAFLAAVSRSVSELREIHWTELAMVAELHAVADEASNGLGVPGAPDPLSFLSFQGESRLSKAGSLATFPPEVIRVVPKLHTPQRGMTLRSTSHYLGALRSTIGVRWLAADPRMLSDESRRDRQLGLLLVPWPFEVNGKIVRPSRRPCTIDMPSTYGFFDFEPQGDLDVELVVRLLRKLQQRGYVVDGLVLPEAALTRTKLQRLLARVASYGVGFILTGIRDVRENCAVIASPHSPRWQHVQHKHHRWCLERNQIRQYQFSELDEGKLWWENIQLNERNVHFVAVTDWFTMCHVICEDLARLDPVDQVIRAVGPNLLVALLQDGPQLRERWASKFASVYADDPGCSVLTLTSLGMSMASRSPSGAPPSRVVGRWVDSITGGHELELLPGNNRIFLSIHAHYQTEFTADGRTDHQTSSYLQYHSHVSV